MNRDIVCQVLEGFFQTPNYKHFHYKYDEEVVHVGHQYAGPFLKLGYNYNDKEQGISIQKISIFQKIKILKSSIHLEIIVVPHEQNLFIVHPITEVGSRIVQQLQRDLTGGKVIFQHIDKIDELLDEKKKRKAAGL